MTRTDWDSQGFSPFSSRNWLRIHVQVWLSVQGTDGLTSPPKDGALSWFIYPILNVPWGERKSEFNLQMLPIKFRLFPPIQFPVGRPRRESNRGPCAPKASALTTAPRSPTRETRNLIHLCTAPALLCIISEIMDAVVQNQQISDRYPYHSDSWVVQLPRQRQRSASDCPGYQSRTWQGLA